MQLLLKCKVLYQTYDLIFWFGAHVCYLKLVMICHFQKYFVLFNVTTLKCEYKLLNNLILMIGNFLHEMQKEKIKKLGSLGAMG